MEKLKRNEKKLVLILSGHKKTRKFKLFEECTIKILFCSSFQNNVNLPKEENEPRCFIWKPNNIIFSLNACYED